MKSMIYSCGLVVIMLMSACSTYIPAEIRHPPEVNPGVDQVRHNSDANLSQKVRWGGIILSTQNTHETTELTVVALPLKDDGEPINSDESPGRFIAIIDDFVEPLVYSPDRKITLTGQVLKTEERMIGEFLYEYPVIKVEHYYLWPPEPETIYLDYPPYPWYDPYYPWRYPYYHYPYY